MMQQFIVKVSDEGVRLDRWFKRHFANLPTSEVQKACRKGLIRVNGAKTKSDARVSEAQEISIKFIDLEAYVKRKVKDELSPSEIKETQSWVLFKNNEVICINKPAGLAVQGGSGLKDFLDRRMSALQFEADEPPRLVHRLDKDTSGLLLLARSANDASKYAKLFASKAVQKTYVALVVGVPNPRAGQMESKMEKSGRSYEKMADSEYGKKAVTEYRTLDHALDRAALVELQPITGRTHQLRLHMSQMECPILGDGKYGGRDAFLEGFELPEQLHLHAHRLVIENEGIDVSAPMSKHMKQSMKQLGLAL